MPFAVKDVLQHKRNPRQIREIHERQYREYLEDLRHQTIPSNQLVQYYLSPKHLEEIDRSRQRYALSKKFDQTRIERENLTFYNRLAKASQLAIVDNQNHDYNQNLQIFSTKRSQQRSNQYKRIHQENQIIVSRIQTARGRLLTKEQCDQEWKKHLVSMKKTCDYPENLERFVSKTPRHEQKHVCPFSKLRATHWNDRHHFIQSNSRFSKVPPSMLNQVAED